MSRVRIVDEIHRHDKDAAENVRKRQLVLHSLRRLIRRRAANNAKKHTV